MADININFHATPNELVDWIIRWTSRDNIYMVAMLFPPISFKQIEQDDLPDIIARPSISRISFLSRPFDSSIKYQGDFDELYSDQLILDIGHYCSDGLRESWLACRTQDVDSHKLWQRIAKDLKSNTQSGVTGFNRQTGASSFHKSHRYSEGAKELELDGVPILPVQGLNGPIIKLGRQAKEVGTGPTEETEETEETGTGKKRGEETGTGPINH